MDATEPEPGYPAAARLCAKCSVLKFDDRRIEPDKKSRGLESDTTKPHPSSRGFCITELKLDYVHVDVLPALPGLQQSADAGCDFCAYLLEAIRTSDTSSATPEPRVLIRLSYHFDSNFAQDYGLNGLAAHLCFPVDESSRGSTPAYRLFQDEGQLWKTDEYLIFKVEAGHGDCRDWFAVEPAPRAEALCAENSEAVRSLLDTCSKQCHHPQDSQFTPTRLLDLCAAGRTDGICLLDAQSLLSTEGLRYAALSYCWGGKKDAARQSITTTSNLSSRLADIRFSSLSRVMQDAVVTARSLEIRYLWIDAACIIQDDSGDWERESEKMGLVYTNAYVTIGALASSSCHESFLSRRNSLTFEWNSTLKPSIRGTYCLRFLRRDGNLWLPDSKGSDYDHSEWGDRAWTLQEEKLSTRLLLFGASKITLTCANRQSVEPFEEKELDLTPELMLDDTSNGQVVPHSQRRIFYESWLDMIGTLYSGHSITDVHDTFPAVSGIAKRVATATGDLHIAGLWKNYLPRGLEWKRAIQEANEIEDLIEGVERSRTYLCPSWSWAAAKWSILLMAPELSYYNYRSECEIISAWSNLVSDLNIFGRIKYAELQIKGREVRLPSDLHLQKEFELDEEPEWTVIMSEYYTATCSLDWIGSPDVIPLQGKLSMLLLSSYSEDGGKDSRDSLDHDDNRHVLGLLLHPAKVDGKYIRVGLFRSMAHEGGLRAFQNYEYREMHII